VTGVLDPGHGRWSSTQSTADPGFRVVRIVGVARPRRRPNPRALRHPRQQS
jgi:hypothetical protein